MHSNPSQPRPGAPAGLPDQPIAYARAAERPEPDWTRIPGFRGVTREEWEDATWQRRHCVKGVDDLAGVLGDRLPADLAASIARDQATQATMSILVPPHMLNTMDLDDLWADPVRRYMLPAAADRRTDWVSHPRASRDSLHEHEMWAAEGLTHRYPTKVLAELLATCPQYCGHCTRMDLVGKDVPAVKKLRFALPQQPRFEAMLAYLRRTPSVRDVVVSGGDVANLPMAQLEGFVGALLEIPHIRDVRLASKGLAGLPQHFLQQEVLDGLGRLARTARSRGVDLALHTHVNAAQQVTPLLARATRALLDLGVRDVRNQGVLLQGVNATAPALLDLCFALLDQAKIQPYYFYMCDLLPNVEHWRVSLAEAQALQHDIMGYLPGFATPRIVCDVPFVGKRWVHQAAAYDRVTGISLWTKNYRTRLEAGDADALSRQYPYYDPIHTLPAAGQAWWREQAARESSGVRAGGA